MQPTRLSPAVAAAIAPSIQYHCTAEGCDWAGPNPSYTDLSDQHPADHELAGQLAHGHAPICPLCFANAERTNYPIRPRVVADPLPTLLRVPATPELLAAVDRALAEHKSVEMLSLRLQL